MAEQPAPEARAAFARWVLDLRAPAPSAWQDEKARNRLQKTQEKMSRGGLSWRRLGNIRATSGIRDIESEIANNS